ncbi:MAG: hypothetical protein ACRELF_00675 [Gemmataceae bacterium]
MVRKIDATIPLPRALLWAAGFATIFPFAGSGRGPRTPPGWTLELAILLELAGGNFK